jgi:hypothetical protein
MPSCASLCFNFFFIFKASFVATTTSIYQWALFAVTGQAAGGGEELQHYCRSSAAAQKLIIKCPPSSRSRPARLMALVTSSSHDLQLLIPSPQFDVDDPHAEALILVFLSLVLLVRLARELVKLLRYLRKLLESLLHMGGNQLSSLPVMMLSCRQS